jgi:hypothetical protein
MIRAGTVTPPLNRWKAGALALIVAFLGAVSVPGQPSREYDVKAAFLYNFITFTDWPASAFGGPDSPYVIGVLGNDPFGMVLDQIVNGEKIKSRPLVVRRFRTLADIHHCHILFICASEEYRLPEILRWLRGQPVLTVADMPGFAEAGGDIGFISGPRVKFVMNPAAIQSGNLIVSSKLLRLAQLVPARRSLP